MKALDNLVTFSCVDLLMIKKGSSGAFAA